MGSLKRFFEERCDKEFLLVAPGGNKGDHLIWAGGRKLADSVDLNYRWTRISPLKNVPRLDEDVVIYVHGNGGFKKDTPWISELLKRLRRRNPDNFLVVGPSTVSLNVGFMENLLNEVHVDCFFTRDLNSYNHMRELMDNVLVDHDEALNLAVGDGYLESVTKIPPNEIRGVHRLLSLRKKDLAETNVSVPVEKYDVVNPEPFYKDGWAKWHYEASSITSNRLHSAVLGCILGKPTYLVRGRWHKQRSVWDYSLKPRGVKWLHV